MLCGKSCGTEQRACKKQVEPFVLHSGCSLSSERPIHSTYASAPFGEATLVTVEEDLHESRQMHRASCCGSMACGRPAGRAADTSGNAALHQPGHTAPSHIDE